MTTSVAQAAATGLPIIATNHSAFPDQVQDGYNGFLVPEGDWQALADKITYLLEHPELWPEFGRRGRQHTAARYDCEVLIERQVALYHEVASS